MCRQFDSSQHHCNPLIISGFSFSVPLLVPLLSCTSALNLIFGHIVAKIRIGTALNLIVGHIVVKSRTCGLVVLLQPGLKDAAVVFVAVYKAHMASAFHQFPTTAGNSFVHRTGHGGRTQVF